jgi:hypothetical protein
MPFNESVGYPVQADESEDSDKRDTDPLQMLEE